MRDSYFDVSNETAIEEILSDKRKTLEAREEDAEFVRRLRQNLPVRFGGRDWEQQHRFDRVSAREERKLQQRAKEANRKEVFDWHIVFIIENPTVHFAQCVSLSYRAD